jgi:hypothetical protein
VNNTGKDCYERYIDEHREDFSEDEYSKAKGYYADLIAEVNTKFQKDKMLFDCQERDLNSLAKSVSEMPGDQRQTRQQQLRSEMFSHSLRFSSAVSDWFEWTMERVKRGFGRLAGVSKQLKSWLTSAVRDHILKLLQQVLEGFITALQKVAKELNVASYSIGISAMFVQLSLTFDVP